MELILQRELPHQQKAVDAIGAVFDGVQITDSVQFYENPVINLADSRLSANIRALQQSIPSENRGGAAVGDCLNLDIKMETGTGKTYVYTKVIYELHKRYGLNKFIIAVPSLAIKAGTAQFLTEEYVRRHFADVCGYDAEIEVGILETQKKKKGRSYFPNAVGNFIRGSSQNTKKIYVLLLNMHLLTTRKDSMLARDDYDYGVEGFYRPLDAIRATRPVVIIDEPHRFSRDQKAYSVITDEIKPQSVIRFGATFPEVTTGRGSNRVTIKDYQNLLYDLNACESFNQNLIKGVAKEHFEPVSKRDEKVKITATQKNDYVTFQYKKRDEATRAFTLKVGDSLSVISESFEGISIEAIETSSVMFSNGISKSQGEEMDVEIYMSSYQEEMLRLALERHFETEKENFCTRTFKIKTLALFFIDDISSYRPGDDGKVPYLLEAFERLLKERIETVLAGLDEHDTEYRAYLEASLADLDDCHAGYFSQDNSDSDEDIAKEVDIILHGKKQLLSFRNADGSYNTLRFLFSKWTLKEGWDNPNVFTIAKLRSSGSENSKLQEVGRGLRLPVDENGNRISNEDFQLNYIVDFTEADFATRLVEQINGEIPQASTISEEKLQQVAQKLGVMPDDLFDTLYVDKRYIDRHRNIKPETRDAFFAEYPDFAIGLKSNKVKDRNKTKPKPVKIRKAVYDEIRALWEIINRRYLLVYDDDLNAGMDKAVLSVLEKPGVFTDVIMTSTKDIVESDGAQVTAVSGVGVQYTVNRPITYGAFLKRITRATNIPMAIMHGTMVEYAMRHGTVDPKYINENSASAFIREFQVWRSDNLSGRFRYTKSNAPLGATALSYADGTPRSDIAQGRIGTKIAPGVPGEKYLYDAFAYDSPLEQKNLLAGIQEVVVYGKIPRCSIAVPTTTGGMYSPDFMYVVKKSTGEKELNIIIETKDVEDKTDLRGEEAIKISCAEVFFKTLADEGYAVKFRTQLGNKEMKAIIDEVLA
jgi:type III restriction enzyme